MNQSFLKYLRIAVSLIFFIATLSLFIDIHELIPTEFTESIIYFQFVPSFIKTFGLLSFTVSGFIIVIVLTALFGRVYCSSICPLGTLQDFLIRLSKKFRFKKKYVYLKPQTLLQNIFLGLFLISLFTGSLLAVNLLDPYSNFGRIAAGFFNPIISLFNNLIVFILESFEIYSLYPVTLGGYTLFGFLFVLSFSSLLIWLSLFHGRLYCNTICPVGTLLGYISKLSFMKIRIDDTNCTGCGICEIKCKGSCIDSDNKYVDHSRCVSCFNCLTVCPSHGIIYSSRIPKKLNLEEKNKTDYDKRNFIGSLLIFSIGLSSILKAQEKIKVFVKNKIKVIRENPITPPGAVSNEGFTEKCTACHLCVSKCPTKVLQPSFLEYGFIGMLQPRMDNFNGFCNYECTICGEVCPTGAIEPVILEEKKLIQIGKAKFIKDNCIVFTQKTDCGACAEHCPTKAVKMLYDEVEKVVAPKIDDKICIGCGACEYACPTQPYKAIYVEANTVHAKAEKPSEEPMEEVILEEFPF